MCVSRRVCKYPRGHGRPALPLPCVLGKPHNAQGQVQGVGDTLCRIPYWSNLSDTVLVKSLSFFTATCLVQATGTSSGPARCSTSPEVQDAGDTLLDAGTIQGCRPCQILSLSLSHTYIHLQATGTSTLLYITRSARRCPSGNGGHRATTCVRVCVCVCVCVFMCTSPSSPRKTMGCTQACGL